MKLKLIVLALVLLVVLCSALQTTSDKAYIWTFSGGYFKLLEVVGMTRTATGWAMPTATPGDTITYGQGIVLTRVPGQPVVVSIDTGQFYMWVSPPTSPGECRSTQPLSDQKILAHDSKFLYVCAPYSDGNTKGTRWGRTPLEFSW